MTEPYAVVVPVKGRNDLTMDLLDDLRRDDGHAALIVFDNAEEADPALAMLVSTIGRSMVVHSPRVGIHALWNSGIRAARRAKIPLVAILNNDIRLGEGCLDTLAEVMADRTIGVCCPNYDGREGTGLVPVDSVCGGLYDGTGGLAGFAMMLRSHGYRFPEELSWWYGDGHLLVDVIKRGLRGVIVTGATCEHVGGGSQTGDWEDPAMQMQLKSDWMTARRLGVVV